VHKSSRWRTARAAARIDLQAEKEQDEPSSKNTGSNTSTGQLDALTEEIPKKSNDDLHATGQSSWTSRTRNPITTDKAEFFRRLRPFYQTTQLFGTLVTHRAGRAYATVRPAPPSWRHDAKLGVARTARASVTNKDVRPDQPHRPAGTRKEVLQRRSHPLVDRAVRNDWRSPHLLEKPDRPRAQDNSRSSYHFEDVAAPT